MTAVAVHPSSRVLLHPLRTRRESDGQWCVGRVEIGEFVVVDSEAVEVLRLLGEGLTVSAVAAHMRDQHGTDVDVVDFVEQLAELGFVAAVDGAPIAGPQEVRPTFAWLRPHHVRWALSPLAIVPVVLLTLAAVVVLAWSPQLVPTYRDLLWSRSGVGVVLGNAAVGWLTLLAHEMGHLITARAAGAPARMSFGTRLQFLVVQTDVSGVRAAPRRVRLTVYLAGIAVSIGVAAAAVIARALVGPQTSAGALLGAVALLSAGPLWWQCLVFMRTDLYFVLADITGCGDLYADGAAYARYLLRRAWGVVTRRGASPIDPSAQLPTRERRAVRIYTVLLVIGTVGCVLLAVAVTLPAAGALAIGAVRDVSGAAGAAARWDGVATLAVLGGFWVLWARAWWRRHGPRVVAWLSRRRARSSLSSGSERR